MIRSRVEATARGMSTNKARPVVQVQSDTYAHKHETRAQRLQGEILAASGGRAAPVRRPAP